MAQTTTRYLYERSEMLEVFVHAKVAPITLGNRRQFWALYLQF